LRGGDPNRYYGWSRGYTSRPEIYYSRDLRELESMMSDALKKHKISKEVLRNFRENVNE
jgi:hypothetical protein